MIEVSKLLVSEELEDESLRHRKTDGLAPVVVLNLTGRCNLDCKHCYSGGNMGRDPNELSTDEAKNLISQLGDYGSPFLIFSGGEPFLREDIYELGRHALASGVPAIISTNGTRIDEETAQKASEAGFPFVGVSLDGLPEANDEFRGEEGAFEKALQGMRNLRDAGVKTGLRFTLTRYNYKDLPELMELLVDEGFHRCAIYHLDYGGRGADLAKHDLSKEERREAVDEIFEKTREINRRGQDLEVLTVGNYADAAYIYMKLEEEDPEKAEKAYQHFLRNGGDGTGEKLACVDEYGNVYPNQFLRESVGNVREKPFPEIWEGDHPLLQGLRNRQEKLNGRCAECKFLDICRGSSRVRALAAHDDLWADDPSCYLTDEEISTK